MRTGCLAIVLHAHLPFVRHPEHERFLEETWLYEAVIECYLPLLLMFEGWGRDRLPARLSLSISPTLGAMLADPLLRQRCRRHLDALIDLAGAEVVRHHWDAARQKIAQFYHDRLSSLRQAYEERGGDLLGGFGRLQASGQLDLLTCSATHAVLPLHRSHPGSVRAQIRAACRQHQHWFGAPPRGFWLPECAYAPELDEPLAEAGVRWFVVETHGLLQARPRPRYGVFAPVITPSGLAAFGRDPSCARQVWSRQAGYPGAPEYRDFYRDIGFDLDLEYLRPHLPAGPARSFTGLKYHRIAGGQAKFAHVTLLAREGQFDDLRLDTGQPFVGRRDPQRHPFDNLNPEALQILDLLRVVSEESHTRRAQLTQHPGRYREIAQIRGKAQADIGFDRICSLVLQSISL